jgi:hypoxanthine phosphoribosyltransferase
MPKRFQCRLVPLEEVHDLSHRLALEIRGSRFEPDLVVAVARGGFVPARLLCDFLGQHELRSVQIRHYGSGARREGPARIVAGLEGEVVGRRVLVVDDVNDTGETVAEVRRHLMERGASDSRIGVLHEKAGSSQKADYRVERLREWEWLVYAWAVTEDVSGFLEQMTPQPIRLEEAADRLRSEYGLELSEGHWRKLEALGLFAPPPS